MALRPEAVPLTDATDIHALSVVHPKAELGVGVRIGPFVSVGAHVRLGDHVTIHSHAALEGHTTLEEGVAVFPHAAIGQAPQDLKYDGSATTLRVGARTVIRECATLQPGSVGEGCGETRVGSDCLVMAYCHIAHDCSVGNGVVIANATQIAGHCVIDDYAVLGGVTTVHQFVRIGRRAITGASSRVMQDVPPFMMADGHPARLHGLNTVGLKRAGLSSDAIRRLKEAYRSIFRGGRYREAIDAIASSPEVTPEVEMLISFLNTSSRGVARAAKSRDLSV